MIGFFGLILFCLFLNGCSLPQIDLMDGTPLSGVELKGGPSILARGKKYVYKYQHVTSGADGFQWSDDKITVLFQITEKSINFQLKSKINKIIKIIWGNSVISKFGKSEKVIHQGVKYINRNEYQEPTVILPNTYVSDMAIPTSNIYDNSGWEVRDLFPTEDYNDPLMATQILESKDEKFSLYLPIEIDGKLINYIFDFKIADVYLSKEQ